MKVIFFNHIDTLALLRNLSGFKKYQEIYYFDISATAGALLKYCRLDKRIRRLNFTRSDLRDENGESFVPKMFGRDLVDLCDKVSYGAFQRDPFIRIFCNYFDRNKCLIFFRKIAALELQHPLVVMNAIQKYRRTHFKDETIEIYFSIERNAFFEGLKEFALKEYGLIVISSPPLWRWIRVSGLAFRNIIILINAIFMSLLNSAKFLNKANRTSPSLLPRIGIAYRRHGINFDLVKRSQFPWLLASDVAFKQILVCFDDKGHPVTEEMVDKLREKEDIGYVALNKAASASPRVPLYKPSSRFAKEAFVILIKLFPSMLWEVLAFGFSGLYYVGKALYFINQYARAYDFYLSANIKINVDRDDAEPYLIAERVALKRAGGVSINYQQGNPPFPVVIWGSCSDVIFLYGPYYHSLLHKSGSDNDTIVSCGFLTDYSFRMVKENSKKIREALINKGAKFIVSYFDEDSSDSRMSAFTNKQNEDIYRTLLRWLISNNEVGLVFSPKKPALLLKRISGVAGLIEEAKATGRCLFMEGKIRTNSWPSEAAQASDLAIGSLVGGTTVLESFLSGVRSVYLDIHGFYSFLEYRYGRDRIVFDNIDNLIMAIDRYRSDKESFDEFGNINLIQDLINSKDPFRDGRAAERMGQYIKWLLDSFNEGKSREEAISLANEKYASVWRKENVIAA